MVLARRLEPDGDAVRAGAGAEGRRQPVRDLREAQKHTAILLARAAESKDPTTGSHVERIYAFSHALARGLGIDKARSEEIAVASMLHDVGKLAVPNRILQKAGPLTAEEWQVMRRHPMEGAQILGASPIFELARDIVRWHHERWDGSGYPDGLRGDEIPLPAAIAAVADVYDALISLRAYKPAWPQTAAVEEVQRMGGVQLHPDVVGTFSRLVKAGGLDETRRVAVRAQR